MTDWKEYKLGEIAEIQNGYAFKSKDFAQSGIPIIKIKNIVPPSVSLEDVSFYNGNINSNLERYLVKKGDFLISMTGSTVNQMASAVGKMGKYPFSEKALLNQRVGKIYSKNKDVSDKYLYYLLNRKEVHYNLAVNASGSANQANISPDQIKRLKFNFPPLPTQAAIAEILSSLDDKIELNNQINQNLEALAQALFKQWFVDFEFPNENGEPYKSLGGEMVDSELGEIPKGWRVDTLDKLLTVKYGKDHKHIEQGKIPIFGSGGVMRYGDKFIYNKISILIPRKGTLSNLFLIEEPFWSVDTMFYTEIHSDEYVEYLYYQLKSLDLASMNVGSAVPSMTTKVLNQLLILNPSKTLIEVFHKSTRSILNTINVNKKENENLSILRDTLLPKLISGELEVNEAEKEIYG